MEEKVRKLSLDVMIDIETMSTNREKGMILSAAFKVFKFDPFDDNFGDEDMECEVFINPTDSICDGFVADEGTQSWWAKQPEEIRRMMFEDIKSRGRGTASALREFYSKLCSLAEKYDLTVWAKGSDFDFVLLENAMKRVGVIKSESELPWRFWRKRDVRTLIDIAKRLHPEGWSKKNAAHGALADCVIQIAEVEEAYDFLRAATEGESK